MVITGEDFELALGALLAKATDDSIKNVLGIFDKEKTVHQNVAKLKDGSSGAALQETIAFLKVNSPAYPVAQHVLSCKNRNKEEYSRDIARFLDFVKPAQCLSCKENYIPAAEKCEPNEPKCYLCQRPSHGECHKDTIIKPELGVIFVCSECLSVKAAKDLAAEFNSLKQDTEPEQKLPVVESEGLPELPASVVNEDQDKEDCPLYLKHICPHGLTGRREINGKPCSHKHRKRCKYYIQYGPDGCHYGKKCHFLHPTLCQNALKLKTCLNRNCQDLHIKGTRRNPKSLQENHQPTTATSNRFPPWMMEDAQDIIASDSRNQDRNERINPWKSKSQTPTEKQSPPKTDNNNSKDFLERHSQEMKADLMFFIRNTITQAIPSTQPQYVMMHPTNFGQQSPPQPAPLENWTNSQINAQIAPVHHSSQTNPLVNSYPHQTLQTTQQMVPGQSMGPG